MIQVDMMYNKDEKSTDEFFQEQGICRGDVGTKRYPALGPALVSQTLYRLDAQTFAGALGNHTFLPHRLMHWKLFPRKPRCIRSNPRLCPAV